MKRGAVIGRRQKPSSKPPWPATFAVRVRSRHKDFHKIFVQGRLMWLYPDTTFSHKKTGNICGQGPLTEPLLSSTLRLLADGLPATADTVSIISSCRASHQDVTLTRQAARQGPQKGGRRPRAVGSSERGWNTWQFPRVPS